jgi:transcriptional regulator with PAS, ATPase and Fis domain
MNAELPKRIWQSLGAAVWTVDIHGCITSWNPGAVELTGFAPDDVMGRPSSEVMPGLEIPRTDDEKGRFGRLAGKDARGAFVLRLARHMPPQEGSDDGWVFVALDASGMDPRGLEIPLPPNGAQEPKIPNIIGDHPLMREVYHRIRLASDSRVSVIITGESGTGKELVAEAIHDLSDRVGRNFVKINCSAIPETLLESELFGHVRGAFTGATFDKIGRFQLADGGTIFLDEIGDISPVIQVKLLRVLQEKTFERVGESLPTSTDVRIVCATNRDLTSLVNRGLFREDLFYRINVFPIHLPALRLRVTDIVPLVRHFVTKIRKSTNKKIESISQDALLLLQRYSWPGNVRQLENAIEHAFVTARVQIISIFDLPADIREGVFQPGKENSEAIPLQRESERERILAALRKTGWNRTRAAKIVGISRVTLWKRIKELGLRQEEK